MSLKLKRKIAARKGARTKRERRDLEHAVHCQRLLRAGMTPQELAVSEGEPLREILRLLRLASFIPHPLARSIGLGATVAEEGVRISEGAFGRDVRTFVEGVQRQVDSLQQFRQNVEKTIKDIQNVLPKLRALP